MRPNVSVEDSPRRSGAEVAVALPDDVAPAELIAALVTALPEVAGEQHLVYEQDGQWTLAFGINALIELDTDELRIVRDGVTLRQTWSGRPGGVLGDAIDRLLLETDQAFGWIAFEFGTYRHNLAERLAAGTPLARIFWPRTRTMVTDNMIRLIGATEEQLAVVDGLIADGIPAAAPARRRCCRAVAGHRRGSA